MGLRERLTARKNRWSIETMISTSFTLLTAVVMIFLGVLLYNVYANRLLQEEQVSTDRLISQTASSLGDYLRNMRLTSDSLTYNVLKEIDLGEESPSSAMSLLYAANKDNLVSIALYDTNGKLLASEPVSTPKANVNVVNQDWFQNAINDPLNQHFSAPHVQELFDYSSYRYYRVVSLSQQVDMNLNGILYPGVLVIDLNYKGIQDIMDELNRNSSDSYAYLTDGAGNYIYHPQLNQIYAEIYNEASVSYENNSDGTYGMDAEGERFVVSIRTVSFTGWKIIHVTPLSSVSFSLRETRYLAMIILIISLIILIILSNLISARLTKPLYRLTHSVEEFRSEEPDSVIYQGGSYEVSYLGQTIQQMIDRIKTLMDTVVKEQEEKRVAELDALQSQINPHFLYNALDSIVWMIEAERNREATTMVRQLATLFRISLSRGKTIITVEDEIKHAENYMNIQKVRYRNKFDMFYEIDPEILPCATVKLILQPILENALYYGVEPLDGDGEITLSGFRDGDSIYLQVSDNGMGMTKEVADSLLAEDGRKEKRVSHGSGVGLVNVHKRIQIRFGQEYGLKIESEPDEGTTITVRLPYQLYEGGTGNE